MIPAPPAFLRRSNRNARTQTALLCILLAGFFSQLFSTPPPSAPNSVALEIPVPRPENQSSLRLRVEGILSFPLADIRASLEDSIQELSEDGLTPAHADDTAYFLSLFFRRYGYTEVDVTPVLAPQLLTLKVREGPRTILRTLKFHGNLQIPENQISEAMIGATQAQMAADPDVFPFIHAEIHAGVARIRGLYESLGFLEAEVQEPEIEVSPDQRSASVSVLISEGTCHRAEPVTLFSTDGALLPDTLQNELLAKVHETNPEAIYHPDRMDSIQRALKFHLTTRGYHDAEVVWEATGFSPESAPVPVTFLLTLGPLFTFEGVEIQGLDRLKPGFLKRRVAPLLGQPYSPTLIEEKYRELLRTGLFKSLRIEPVPRDHTILLRLVAEEARAREVGFSFGAGTYEGFSAGIRLSDRNLFGSGRPLRLDLEASQRTRRGELVWNDPWFLDARFLLRARAYVQTREEPGYAKNDTGTRVDLGRLLGQGSDATLFAQLKHVAVTSLGIPELFLGDPDYTVGTLGITHSIDRRNSPTNPTKGWILSGTLDTNSVSGASPFSRATGRFSSYHPVGNSLTLSLGARAGLLLPADEIPIDERFFLGGATSVRSFQERRMGPSDGVGHSVGGTAFTLLNAELSFPLPKSVEGVVFVDAGNLLPNSSDISFSDLRFGVGVGLRYRLPIGPLRLDAALNPDPRQGEPVGAFHFIFGTAF
jgi:outer membrane protein insertion porin family